MDEMACSMVDMNTVNKHSWQQLGTNSLSSDKNSMLCYFCGFFETTYTVHS